MRNIILIIFFVLINNFIVPGLSQQNISNSDEPSVDQLDRLGLGLDGSQAPATQSQSQPVQVVESTFVKIFNTIFGGDVAKVGFLTSIPVAIASSIIWAKIFLVIYHVFWANGFKDFGGGPLGPTYDFGRSMTGEVSNFIFSAIEKFGRTDEKN